MERSDFRNFLKNKKGVELTLNTVIIAILVVLVLIVIVGFFLGGTTKAKNTIADIFSASVAGSDLSLAVQQCENFCEQARGWSDTLKISSPYCTKTFNLDLNLDGIADGSDDKINTYHCGGEVMGVECPEVSPKCGATKDNTN